MKKILIADDSKFIRTKIIETLSKNGYNDCYFATNGEELIKMAEEIKPNVIIADITMEKYDGIEAMKILKKGGCQSKFLICSARNDMLRESIEAGADDFVLKPYSETEFIKVINNIIK